MALSGNELFIGGMVVLILALLFALLKRWQKKKQEGVSDEDIDKKFFE